MKLLLLAGTAQARALAGHLAPRAEVEVIASLAGATRDPAALPVPTRIGGFGGGDRQKDWIVENRITAVIDATHPFAVKISARTAAICADLGLPCLHLVRPGWRAQPGDRWTRVGDLDAAARALPDGAVAFLATGRQSLAAFARRADATLYLRQIDPPEGPFPMPKGGYVIGMPPVSDAEEARIFKQLGVEVLVVKDAGGPARAKLDAARALALPVIVIDRPAAGPGEQAATVEEALAWVERQLRCA